jgi:acyl carrier protein
MESTNLIPEITNLILQSVNLKHMKAEDISPDLPLTKDGLNLDSVDVLEVVVAIEQKYKVKVKDADVGRKYFQTIRGIADFVQAERG